MDLEIIKTKLEKLESQERNSNISFLKPDTLYIKYDDNLKILIYRNGLIKSYLKSSLDQYKKNEYISLLKTYIKINSS